MSNGSILDNVVKEIKSRCDIVDIISEYVVLKPQGRNYVGLCPFHDDTHPSLYVSRERQLFKCFACDTAGDVITFLMKHLKLTYSESVKMLAEKCNYSIPEDSAERSIKRFDTSQIRSINMFAMDYYHKLLINSPAGKQALSYLRGRGIDDKTIESFKLGYSLPSWDDFLNSARRNGYEVEAIHKAGFILKSKNGNYFDRFRGRIMFPIFDIKGEPIAFGGRILVDSESEPKYINSPETPIYTKGKTLYNLNLAYSHIQKAGFAILVEGYMDVISCFQAGICNIIASLGTSLSEGHVRLIKRYTDEVVIAYDSDKAGQSATVRGMDLLVRADIRVKVLNIPTGKDPDEFVRSNGAKQFIELVSNAVDLVDYKIGRVRTQVDLNSVEGKKKAVNELITTLANMNNEIERAEYIKKCAEQLDIEEGFIWQELEKVEGIKKPRRSSKPMLTRSKKLSAREVIERNLIECLVQYPQFIQRSRSVLTKEDFLNPFHAELISLLWDNYTSADADIDLASLINKCDNEESRKIISDLILRKNTLPDGEATFNGCIKKIREFKKRELIEAITKSDTNDNIAKAKQLMELISKKDQDV